MKIYFLPPGGEASWTELDAFSNLWFANEYGDLLAEKLVIVMPRADIEESKLKEEDFRWREIFRACCRIKSSQPGGRLKAWRVIHKYGDEIAPGLGVFRFRESKPPCLFWLSSDEDMIETQARLADLLPKISAYWHIERGRGLLHAAGIIHKGQAYLFAGASGAGKSTVSALSRDCGHQIIHDDHLVVYQEEKGPWLVSNTLHSFHDIPIKAVLFLVQDTVDRLIPLKSTTTALRLLDGLREHGHYVLFKEALRKAFATMAEMARNVPGFELHFRKSPDFWNRIDEQFPD
jgi:hypothetical protein